MSRAGWIVLLLAAGAWDPVTRRAAEVEHGNQRYAAGDYSQAEQRYREAEKRLPREPAVQYDLGATLHRQALALPAGPERDQRFEEAEKALRQALDSSDAKLRSKSHYNLGNTLFERARYGEAVDEYKKSLKLDPAHEDARHNLELALRLKKEQPPQQPKQDPDQQKPDQQKPDQQKPDQQDPDQQKPDQQKPDQQKPAEAEAEGDREEKQPARDLSEEDVERKLGELERRSKDLQVQKAAERAQERRRGKQVKDW